MAWPVSEFMSLMLYPQRVVERRDVGGERRMDPTSPLVGCAITPESPIELGTLRCSIGSARGPWTIAISRDRDVGAESNTDRLPDGALP
jgi:hypothetical protein